MYTTTMSAYMQSLYNYDIIITKDLFLKFLKEFLPEKDYITYNNTQPFIKTSQEKLNQKILYWTFSNNFSITITNKNKLSYFLHETLNLENIDIGNYTVRDSFIITPYNNYIEENYNLYNISNTFLISHIIKSKYLKNTFYVLDNIITTYITKQYSINVTMIDTYTQEEIYNTNDFYILKTIDLECKVTNKTLDILEVYIDTINKSIKIITSLDDIDKVTMPICNIYFIIKHPDKKYLDIDRNIYKFIVPIDLLGNNILDNRYNIMHQSIKLNNKWYFLPFTYMERR